MTLRVRVERIYEVDAEKLWATCVSYTCLSETMASILVYDGLPEGELLEGQSVEVKITHIRVIPEMNWFIDVIERDDVRHILRTSERGGAIRSYLHTFTVDSIGEGCSRLVDEIVFDAGWQSIPMWFWIRHMYKARDKPRRRLLGLTS